MAEIGFERLIALVAFAGTYLGLALGRLPVFRVDRTGVAIIGGALVVVSGLLPWDRAVAAVARATRYGTGGSRRRRARSSTMGAITRHTTSLTKRADSTPAATMMRPSRPSGVCARRTAA